MKKFIQENWFNIGLLTALVISVALSPTDVFAHRSGCHRWHSCPSDSGSYTCGDAGHPCQYPTYPASGVLFTHQVDIIKIAMNVR